ncbi:hypothetical protein BGZ59_002452 [Podila verticillata]|nr:hypothetical protein BGZ59_002452 [Podila verticillata]KFH72786.1 hypothetical protein MVEG_00012 [Podila verticillata NRRL 6337]
MSLILGFPSNVSRKTCIKSLEFSFDWSVTESTPPPQNYDGGDGFFTLSIVLAGPFNNSGITFRLSPRTTFAQSFTIKTPSGSCLASGPLVPGVRTPGFGMTFETQTLAERIPRSRLEILNGRYQVDVCLSSRQYSAPAPKPFVVAPKPVASDPATSLLNRLYRDVDNRDVSFILSPADLAASNETLVRKAHKVVLNQWPYFKRMFNSDFMEGGKGEKEIKVTNVKPKVFQLLLRFMYTGIIPQEERPFVAFTDAIANPQEASWEDVFLAAHRYELEELCDLAHKNILDKLTPQTAIPFLFRTGYLFETLRAPVIKYTAKTSASQAASKSFRDTYQDHPEFGALVFEIFEAYHGSK